MSAAIGSSMGQLHLIDHPELRQGFQTSISNVVMDGRECNDDDSDDDDDDDDDDSENKCIAGEHSAP
ncbi:predicted protein [Sclerotinia sclerotiorum 1980 UF-70]|uniref:Uncharacterized protein n=1 Tax=Sclerotinia sclerotiorum (strain ATCC 18683 / 1980 / Ss-1) TaxID=665079 RepID=A7FA55_SCLS1|nr:predicted protein [Sclerotinia sclerotiorum 1980 UF-70]EDO00616.1 predicted protein [Sclerotinia sclerotiorum 1980 UF-70]